MKTHVARTLITSVVCACSLVITTSAQDTEKRVKMNDLPEAVRKTVEEQSKGAKLRGLAKETEEGKTYYEAELRVGGHSKDVLIDETGAVIEIEEQVALSSVPPAVKATIEKNAGKRKIKDVESITKNGAIVGYEAHFATGAVREIKVAPNGELMPK